MSVGLRFALNRRRGTAFRGRGSNGSRNGIERALDEHRTSIGLYVFKFLLSARIAASSAAGVHFIRSLHPGHRRRASDSIISPFSPPREPSGFLRGFKPLHGIADGRAGRAEHLDLLRRLAGLTGGAKRE